MAKALGLRLIEIKTNKGREYWPDGLGRDA